jgi:hypothetical protein
LAVPPMMIVIQQQQQEGVHRGHGTIASAQRSASQA